MTKIEELTIIKQAAEVVLKEKRYLHTYAVEQFTCTLIQREAIRIGKTPSMLPVAYDYLDDLAETFCDWYGIPYIATFINMHCSIDAWSDNVYQTEKDNWRERWLWFVINRTSLRIKDLS